jgi:hypothetical protein
MDADLAIVSGICGEGRNGRTKLCGGCAARRVRETARARYQQNQALALGEARRNEEQARRACDELRQIVG